MDGNDALNIYNDVAYIKEQICNMQEKEPKSK